RLGARARDSDRDPGRRAQAVRPPLPARGGRQLTFIEPGPDFSQLFRSFEHTAFRLETRDRYDSPREAESFHKFLAGKPDASYHENWLNMLREAPAERRLFSRVRVVSFPLSSYTRFAMWVAGYTREAGDDIRYLTRDRADAAELPKHDFWLFDSSKLVLMHFSED